MLSIRDAQMEVLAGALFERWLIAHVERFFPDHCAALGPAGVRTTVTQAARTARGLGFDADAGVARFVDLTFVFGPDFHRSDNPPGARRALIAGPVDAPSHRMRLLYTAGLDHLR